MLNRSEQRRIMRDDAKRRNARELVELAEYQPSDLDLSTTPGAWVNPVLVRGIGVVNPPLRVRASAAAITGPRTRTVATAVDAAGTPVLTDDGRATVAVTRNGVTTYVAATNFGRSKAARSRQPATAQSHERHITCADLAPIGQDYE